ncbi:hypothetical protein EMUCRT_0491 [Ehrlichia cf. muris str. EmCRT]|uniref:Uncharacterized protein n=1 Tax=Ehrlichia cf. muris str. EmCRT TaxID=1359167 RepID=A0A0F3NCX7_9RICK|nr:hypothetical protein EMUCRT_0491 [Ehrlichia cf. muris str. EmCRT]
MHIESLYQEVIYILSSDLYIVVYGKWLVVMLKAMTRPYLLCLNTL